MSFLQSGEWQEIQERIGRGTFRIDGILVIQHDLPWGLNYLYAPRPESLGENFFPEARKLAAKGRSVFLKVDPLRSLAPSLPQSFPSFPIQALATTVIDCRTSEAELLSAMHPKTRYNIRLAERHGVKVRRASEPGDSDIFLRLLTETAARDGFSPHPPDHYRALLAVRSNDFENQLWLAEYKGQTITAALVNAHRPAKTATYLHGASSGEHREVMAPHLLHWEIIRETKRRGFVSYDLGGIDEKRWPGLSRFKKSFGGAALNFPETRDFAFRPALWRLYRLQHKLRHLI